MAGYHKAPIPKGTLGKFSKIEEEFLELKDAQEQDIRILKLCECCDLLGAIEAYALEEGFTMQDLLQMMNLTKKAFQDRTRRTLA